MPGTFAATYPSWNVNFEEIDAEGKTDIRAHILNSDLRQMKIQHTLPTKIRDVQDALVIKSGFHIAQIAKVENTCHPKEHCAGHGYFKEHSVLMFHMVDASGQRFSGFELMPLGLEHHPDDVSLLREDGKGTPNGEKKRINPGEKVLLGPEVFVKQGFMVFTPQNFQLLGGNVERILEQQKDREAKERILWLQTLPLTEKKNLKFLTEEQKPPKYVPFDKENSVVYKQKLKDDEMRVDSGENGWQSGWQESEEQLNQQQQFWQQQACGGWANQGWKGQQQQQQHCQQSEFSNNWNQGSMRGTPVQNNYVMQQQQQFGGKKGGGGFQQWPGQWDAKGTFQQAPMDKGFGKPQGGGFVADKGPAQVNFGFQQPQMTGYKGY